MECGCFFNDVGFKVGRKYVTVYNVYSCKVLGRKELNDWTIGKLREIEDLYRYEDCRRTRSVRDFVLGQGEYREENEED